MREYDTWELELKQIKQNKKVDNIIEHDEKKETALQKLISENIDLKEYTLYFMILKEDASSMRKYKGENKNGYTCPQNLFFNQDENIFDFTILIKKVNSLSEIEKEDTLGALLEFMNRNEVIFGTGKYTKSANNNVESIIKEYADNFTEKLFRHKYCDDSNITLDNLFVMPKIEYKYNSEYGINQENKYTRNLVRILNEFFWNVKTDRILFIEGDAAIGKTSIVSWMCYHYLKNDEEGKAVFLKSNVVCVRLRELDFSDKNKDIQNKLLEYLGFESIETFKNEYKNSILILDGADEISMIEGLDKTGIENLIISIRKIFQTNKIIITSRPQFIDLRAFSSKNFNTKVVKLAHFDKKMREEWIEKYEKCGEKIPESTKAFILSTDDDKISGVADTPLALYLLVACEIKEEFIENQWALYHEIFKNAIINTEYNENFNSFLNHPIKNYEELLYRIVCRISFEMFKNTAEKRYYIKSNELQDIISEFEIDSNISEWVRKCCVLCAYWKTRKNIGALEFYHNNIRDYFFCEFIYEKVNELIKEGVNDNKEVFINKMCEIMPYAYIAETTWEQTLLFLYQKLKYMNNHLFNEYNEAQSYKQISVFFENIFGKPSMLWTYQYKGMYYQKIKYTIINTLLLLRIYQKSIYEKSMPLNEFWNSEECYRDIVQSNILGDWRELFKQKISIQKEKWISIGQDCKLDNAFFSKETIENAYFENASMTCIDFSETCLKKSIIKKCKIVSANFVGANLKEVTFVDSVLKEISFKNVRFEKCIFENTKILGGEYDDSIFQNCIFNETEVINVDWAGAKVRYCDMANSSFEKVLLNRAKFRKMKIYNNTFTSCDLSKTDMENAVLRDNKFIQCCLNESKLISSNIIHNKFIKDTSLKNVNFSRANIIECEIVECNFEDSRFAHCKIQKNIWENTNLNRTDFRNTRIYDKDYKQLSANKADLRWGVKKVTLEDAPNVSNIMST